MKIHLTLLLIVLMMTAIVGLTAAGAASMPTTVIADAGNRSAGSRYALESTLQQPSSVGVSSGSRFTLQHGFWHPDPCADAGDDFFGYESRGPNSWLKYVCQLNATHSVDAETFLWLQAGGIPVVLDNPSSPTPIFDAPMWDGSTELTKTEAALQFNLTVNQSLPEEHSDEIVVYIRIPGDANGDDLVNAFDVAKMRQVSPDADFNGDGRVNAFDVSILRLNAGRRRTVE